ncbi:MAG TPA: PAS domain S-box protein [Acidimicrobiales bacterium]|nr:PAS domain S-box protein [Acidimicrobiales bacterium]
MTMLTRPAGFGTWPAAFGGDGRHIDRDRLATFVGLSGQILCVADDAHVIAWHNGAFERALGAPTGALVGRTLLALTHPDDVALWEGLWSDAAGAGERTGLRVRVRAARGSWRCLEWTLRLDRDRRRCYGAARDVTDQLAAEASRRDSEARLRAILEHSPSAIFVEDLEGRYQLVNSEWSRLTGVGPDEAVGRNAAEMWPDTAQAITVDDRHVLAEQGALVTDERRRTADGVRDYMFVRFLLRDPEGTPTGIAGIATDITERKHVERALAERERVLDTVLDTSPDIISLMDRHGRIRQASRAQRAMLGYPEGAPDVDMFALVHPDDFPAVAQSFVDMVDGKADHAHVQYRVRHAEGHWMHFDSRGRALLDEHGRFDGAALVSRDVTAKLESDAKLQSAREAAENASSAKSEFLSRMSHELRTPLNAVLGFAQLLQMDGLPLAQADAVEHILRAGRHLLDLIDEVLDIARIESGHLDLAMAPVDVEETVADAVMLVRPLAERAEVSVHFTVGPEGGPAVLADRQRLVQVLLNLLSNAVKYNRPGGRVDVSWENAPDRSVRIVVADTGRGIRPEDLDRVFVPFDRIGAEQRGVEGTGVGLAVSKHLVEQMGGELGVESVPEVGSTFDVRLCPAETPADAGAAMSEGPVSSPSPVPDGVFRVLLVESELTSLDLVERVLSRRPRVEVLAAMHAGLGVDLARQHRPDLVLLDLDLPDMAAATVIERLKADPVTARIPLATVSADASPTEVRELLRRGVVGHLAKPLDVRGLLSLVDAVAAARD